MQKKKKKKNKFLSKRSMSDNERTPSLNNEEHIVYFFLKENIDIK